MAEKKFKSKLFIQDLVDNTKRKFGANLNYFGLFVELPNGEWVPALLTENEIRKACARAAKNNEDIGPKDLDRSWLAKRFGIMPKS